MKKIFILVMSFYLYQISYAQNSSNQPPWKNSSFLNVGMDQHGSFTLQDLRSSPLLRSLFNLTIEPSINHQAKVCIEPQHDCKLVKDTDRVNIVNSNGITKFYD